MKEMVIVLDSNDTTRKELCDLILEIGVLKEDVFCTGDVQTALKVLHEQDVCLVIVEASMEFQKGYSIVSLLDVNPNTQILVKAFVEELGPIYSAVVKVHGILEKPVQKEQLRFYINKSIQISTICKNLDAILEKMQLKNIGCEEYCPLSIKREV